MEYDRALYRVYEHVMEDLNASSSPIIQRPSTSTTTTTATSPNSNLQQQQAQAAPPIPLFLPSSLSPLMEVLLQASEQRGGWRGVCSLEFVYRLWRVCATTLTVSSQETTEEGGGGGGGARQMGIMGRMRRNGHVRLATNDVNVENGEDVLRNGLRRRGGSSEEDHAMEEEEEEEEYDSEGSGGGGSSSVSSASSSSQAAEEDEETLTNTSENLPTSASLAQNVARTQLSTSRRRRRRRRRRRTTPSPPSPPTNNTTTQNQRISEGCTQKGLYNLMRLSLILGIFHLIVLKCLHDTYIGSVMKQNALFRSSLKGDDKRLLVEEEEDSLRTCLEYALQTRPVEERGAYFRRFGDASSSSSSDEEEDDGEDTGKNDTATVDDDDEKEEEVDPPLLGKDEILQIKILYGGECTGQCSRVHTIVQPSSNLTTSSSSDETEKGKQTLQSYITQEWSYHNPGLDHYLQNSSSSSSPLETEEYWKDSPHYRFSTSEALLYLDSKTLLLHNVSVVNVTLTERCLSSGSDQSSASLKTKTSEIFSQIYGMDSAILSQLMYGIKSSKGDYRGGHVQSMETKERWSWDRELLEGFEERRGDFWSWFLIKIGDLFLAILSFFLIMSVTALIVRVLTTSGVVVMFPIFACFRACGLPGADDRILNLSYSWIGRARIAIDRRGFHTSWHLIGAHLAKIFLYYIMYEACQAAWSVVLYSKSVPAAMPVWVYAFAMIWEYFSMVFVRSVLSVYFFPRIIFLYFTFFHLYFYSVPYGYYDVALIPLFLFSVQAMIYTLIALEAPAAARGAVSMECPREVYNRLSWPEWSASIPNEWTLFLPLNSRYTTLYDQEVEDVVENNVDDATGEDNGANGEDDAEGDAENDDNDDTTTTLSVPLGNEDVRTENDVIVDSNETGALSESDPSTARSGLHARRGITQH